MNANEIPEVVNDSIEKAAQKSAEEATLRSLWKKFRRLIGLRERRNVLVYMNGECNVPYWYFGHMTRYGEVWVVECRYTISPACEVGPENRVKKLVVLD